MASKLARKIGCLLAGANYVHTGYLHDAVEVIDRAIQGKTISAKEVARLQENESCFGSCVEANNDLLRTNTQLREAVEYQAEWKKYWAGWYGRTETKAEKFRNKLWDAEQEVHDLKYELGKHRETATNLLCEEEKEISRLRKEIERLQKTGTTLASYIILKLDDWDANQFIKQEHPLATSEQITPPPCLKPLDAMKWNESVVTGTITYRG
jgi:hypothetical protein